MKLRNKTVSSLTFTQLKNIVRESTNGQEKHGWADCVDAVFDAVDGGEMTWEDVAREALCYMSKDSIIDMAERNGWKIFGPFDHGAGEEDEEIEITEEGEED